MLKRFRQHLGLGSLDTTLAEFFAFLAAHTDRVVAGANATSRLVNGLGSPAGAAESAFAAAAKTKAVVAWLRQVLFGEG